MHLTCTYSAWGCMIQCDSNPGKFPAKLTCLPLQLQRRNGARAVVTTMSLVYSLDTQSGGSLRQRPVDSQQQGSLGVLLHDGAREGVCGVLVMLRGLIIMCSVACGAKPAVSAGRRCCLVPFAQHEVPCWRVDSILSAAAWMVMTCCQDDFFAC